MGYPTHLRPEAGMATSALVGVSSGERADGCRWRANFRLRAVRGLCSTVAPCRRRAISGHSPEGQSAITGPRPRLRPVSHERQRLIGELAGRLDDGRPAVDFAEKGLLQRLRHGLVHTLNAAAAASPACGHECALQSCLAPSSGSSSYVNAARSENAADRRFIESHSGPNGLPCPT
jgi:hypothetical protein